MFSIPNIPDPIVRELYAELCRSLPPPPNDTPERLAIREQHAMTTAAHLLPENAAEATLAANVVAAQFHARDALQEAARPGIDPDERRRCRAQAASMMRQADSGIRTLLRLQAERQKAEDVMRPAAMQRAGYWFRSVSVPEPAESPDMTQGLDHQPAAPTRQERDGERQPSELPPTQPPLPLREGDGGSGPAALPKLEYGAMTPAERYVTLYPDRAAAVLDAGGQPASPTFPPPDPELVAELLAGTSPLVHAFRQANEPTAGRRRLAPLTA